MTTSRINSLLELLKSEPNDSFLNYALALEYAKLNELDKATELIETLLIRDENYLGAYYQLGKFYEEKNSIDKAVSIYKKGLSVAKKQNKTKTIAELNEALLNLED